MKFRQSVLLGITALSFGEAVVRASPIAQASSWHTSAAIPAHLRGHWYAKYDHSQGVKIYRHNIRYTGESAAHVTAWKYAGNHFYKFKYAHSSGFTILLHYFGPHKISMNSMMHSYFK
jgi:hypothetical protein